jgi:hypothetical protein
MQIREFNKKKFAQCSEEDKKKNAERITRIQKEGEKMIKGMFEFLDAQGGWIDFNYRFYPGEPIRSVRIVHGEICDMPRDLVKHLNNIWKKVKMMPDNKPIDLDKGNYIITKRSRTRFTPIDAF